MMISHRILAGIIAAAWATSLLASPGAHGPNGEHLDGAASQSAGGLARLPDGSVNVPKLAQRRMGVRTLMVKEGAFARSVTLNGRAAIDPNAGGRVQAPFAGQIAPGPQGLPVAGQRVVKGQLLARIAPVGAAIERGNQAAQLAALRASRTVLEKRVQRLALLEGVVPAKDIDAARAELQGTIGQERAVASSISGTQAIVAPASGVIASAAVLAGQIVESRDILFEIVDPQRMVIEALTTDAAIARKIRGATLVDAPDAELTLLGGGLQPARWRRTDQFPGTRRRARPGGGAAGDGRWPDSTQRSRALPCRQRPWRAIRPMRRWSGSSRVPSASLPCRSRPRCSMPAPSS